MASLPDMTTTERPEAPVLVPVLGYRYALKLQHLLLTLAFGGLFLYLNILPLRNVDLWGNILFGQWIMDHHGLPSGDPFQPLAVGMRGIDTAWLSQVIFAKVDTLGGGKGLSILFAAVTWLSYVILARTFWLQGHSLLAMAGGVLVALGVSYSRVGTIRPEMFSLLCGAILLWMLTPKDDPRTNAHLADARPRHWLRYVVPLLFVVWANLHSTFVGGCLILLCYAFGRFFDAWIDTRSFRHALADRAFRSWLLLAETAIAATLINPYSVDLWLEAIRASSNPILRDIAEWNSLVVLGLGGREFIAGCLLLFAVLRLSPRRLYGRETLLLLTFGLLTLLQVRLIGWFAPVLAFVLVPHVAELLRRWRPQASDEAALAASLPVGELPPGRSFRYTLLCATVAWVIFAFSGLGELVLGSTPRSEKSLYGDVPFGVVEYLNKEQPQGQYFNPSWWGDWLVAKGPEGLQPFVTTNVQLVPRQVWIDYRRIQAADGAIDTTLDRYKVNTVIVDKTLQPVLAGAMLRLPGWGIAYEDEQAAIYRRFRKKANGNGAPAKVEATEPAAEPSEPAKNDAAK